MSRLLSSARIKNPSAVYVTMEFTMDLEDWELLLEQLKESKSPLAFPCHDFIGEIRQLSRELRAKVDRLPVGPDA